MEEIKMQDLKTVKHKPQVHSQATIWENVCFFKLIVCIQKTQQHN